MTSRLQKEMASRVKDMGRRCCPAFTYLADHFGEDATRERALNLLKTKNGLMKWYERHYGYPLDSTKFVRLSVRPLSNFEGKIDSIIEGDALASQEICFCTLGGPRITTFSEALYDVVAPPAMIVWTSIEESNFILLIKENNELWFSSSLWQRLLSVSGLTSENLINSFAK